MVKIVYEWTCNLCFLKTAMGNEDNPQGWKVLRTGELKKEICARCWSGIKEMYAESVARGVDLKLVSSNHLPRERKRKP